MTPPTDASGGRTLLARWSGRIAGMIGFLGLAAIAALNLADAQGRVPFGPFFTVARSQVYVAGEALLVIAAAFGIIARSRANAIERENASLKHRAVQAEAALTKVYERELRSLAERLGFYSDERINLFLQHGDYFVLVARYSASPPLCAAGRPRYHTDKGCIGVAWDQGRDRLELPDPRMEPDAYFAGQASRGIDAQTASAFRMKSRTYLAFRIETADRPLGVLVFESRRTVEMVLKTKCVLEAEAIFAIMKGEGYGNGIEAVLESASLLRAP